MKSLNAKTTFYVIKESMVLKARSTIRNTEMKNITNHTAQKNTGDSTIEGARYET